MKDEEKTRAQLIGELAELRGRIAELEAAGAEPGRAELALQEERSGRMRAEEVLGIQTAELEARQRIIEKMLGSLDLDERLGTVLEEAINLLEADAGGIWLAERGRIVLSRHRGVSKRFAAQEGDLPAEGVEAPAGREPVLRHIHRTLEAEGMGAVLVSPLIDREDHLGGFLAIGRWGNEAFSEAQAAWVMSSGDLIALMIEHARLYRLAQERLARLIALREIDRAISASLSLDEIIAVVLERVLPHIEVDAAGLSLIDRERGRTELARLHLPDGSRVAEEAFGMADSLLEQLMERRETVVIYDVKADPRVQNHRGIIRRYGLCSYVGEPLVVRDRVIGVLHVFTTQPVVFSDEDLEFFRTLAGQAAISVQNARLFEETRQAYEELKSAQDQLLQAQKMESVGRLAAGIAHDFNNMLTPMMAMAQLLEMRDDIPAPIKADLRTIVTQGQRAAQLVRQIMDFSRKTVVERRPVEMEPILRESVELLEHMLPETTRLEVNIPERQFMVYANPSQLQQALMNLAVNAQDAMPGGGRLAVSLESLRIGEGERPPVVRMAPGNYVVWRVSDTGAGMPPEVVVHVFEPFFTTKAPGEGTGLGLAQVYGIVKQHGGEIVVDSEEGKGTAFTIYLPEIARAPVAVAKETGGIPEGQGETVLLVEDEPAVRQAVLNMLEALNYRVLVASNGLEALEVYRACREEIAVVLTDMVMPKMGGVGLFKALKEADPGIRVVMITGYSPTGEEVGPPPPGIAGLIEKPPMMALLAQALADALKR